MERLEDLERRVAALEEGKNSQFFSLRNNGK